MRRLAILCFAWLMSISAWGAVLEGGIFRIEYSDGLEGIASESLAILEAGLVSYSEKLPAGGDPIHIHIAGTLDEFRELWGAAPARTIQGFARSSEGIIAIKARRLLGPHANYAAILRHELLHVLLARNTNPDNLPRWLNEGIAMELSREYRFSSMYRVARMYASGAVIPYAALPRAFAAPGNEEVFGDAYAQSLSMTKFLRQQLGEAAFWRVIADLKTQSLGQTLRSRTPFTPESLYEEWTASLWRTAVVTYSVSGIAALPLGALLLVLAYLRKQHKGRRMLRQWDKEDDEDIILFPSDLEDREPPYPWEEE